MVSANPSHGYAGAPAGPAGAGGATREARKRGSGTRNKIKRGGGRDARSAEAAHASKFGRKYPIEVVLTDQSGVEDINQMKRESVPMRETGPTRQKYA
jgi:hypothetical protein